MTKVQLTGKSNTSFAEGDEVSYGIGSDRQPAEVISVSKTGHKVVTRDLDVMVTKGDYTEAQDYVTMSDENQRVIEWTRRGNGRYQEKGANYAGASVLSHGARWYRDPSF